MTSVYVNHPILMSLLEASADPAIAIDSEQRVLATNEPAMPFLCHATLSAEIWQIIDDSMGSGRVTIFGEGAQAIDFSGVSSDFGKIKGRLSPLKSAFGDVAALVIFRQIEPRSKPSSTCSQSPPNDAPDYELHRDVLRELPAILAVKDAKTRKFLLTRGASLIGLDGDDGFNVGKTADDIFEPALATAIRQAEDDLISSGDSIQERIFSTQIAGVERSFLSRRKVVKNTGNEPHYLLLINIDVTHEVQIHKALDRSQSFLSHVIQSLPCQVSVTDVESGELVLTNSTGPVNSASPHPSVEQDDGLDELRSLMSTTADCADETACGRSEQEHAIGSAVYLLKQRRLEDPIGETSYLLSVAEDITERRNMLDTLQRNESNLHRSQKVAKLGSWSYDLVTGAIEWSKTLFNIWGTEPESFEPSVDAIMSGIVDADRDEYLNAIHSVRTTGVAGTTIGRIKRLDGIILHVRVEIEPEFDVSGNVARLFGIVQDIGDQIKAEARMRYLAHHDALTALPNRALFEERLERTKLLTKRQGLAFAVHCVDLDDFKGINDTLGHTAGDQLLKDAADRLSLATRESDTVARVGADEFAVIQEGIAQEEDAAQLAERIILSLSSPYRIEQQDIFSSATIGLSFAKNLQVESLDPFQQANMALAEAKKHRRGGFRFFSASISATVKRRKRINQRIRKALEDQIFRMAYQPQYCISSNEIIGVEALMRWQDQELGNVPPDQFIGVAEEQGLILNLGEFALRQSCLQAKRWLDDGVGALRTAVNLSPAQFAYQDLVELVSVVLDESGLPPHLLELEITEGTLMRDGIGAVDTIKELHKIGVSLAIDDFGSGYSSLSYLKRFNVEKIKIDRTFVKDLPDDPDDATITRTIINLGRSLGMSVLAEGVETGDQLDFLKRHGCDEIQGYHIAKPMFNDKLLEFLQDGNYTVTGA